MTLKPKHTLNIKFLVFRMSGKEKYKKRRGKLATNKAKYEIKKAQDKAASRAYRAKMSGEARERYNEKARIRMKRLREKKKEVKEKPQLTEKQILKRRQQWRHQKHKQRQNETPETKAAKKRKSLMKALSSLSPAEFLTIVQTVTPSKKAAMDRRGFITSPRSIHKCRLHRSISDSLRVKIKKLLPKRDKDSAIKKKILTMHLTKSSNSTEISYELGMKWETWQRYSHISEELDYIGLCSRKQRMDAFQKEMVDEVETFYENRSITLPLRRFANKSVLADSVVTLHKEFNTNRINPVSLSKFSKLRPKHVLTMDRNKFNACMCEYCLNIDYKVS